MSQHSVWTTHASHLSDRVTAPLEGLLPCTGCTDELHSSMAELLGKTNVSHLKGNCAELQHSRHMLLQGAQDLRPGLSGEG